MEDFAIKVENVSKIFKLPYEKNNSIKSAVVNFYKRKKGYELQQALKDVSFEVKKGEFFGIVGRNGSGKSTLLKLLAGIYSPTTGSVVVNGVLVPFIELGVGFNMELTGRENVFLNGALLGFGRKEVEAMYDDIVSFAELGKFMDQRLKNYSSGMQVRLAFSIAIRAKGDILLLDEVLAVGDAAFQQKCFDYFEDLKKENKTVIFVSHDMGAIKRFCTSAIYIRDGKVIEKGNPEDIADIYAVDNIRAPIESEDTSEMKPQMSTGYRISSKIKPKEEVIEVNIGYHSSNDSDMYIGISVTHNGASIGEITTSLKEPLRNNGKIKYELPIVLFNPGLYQIAGVTLFKLDNRQILAIDPQRHDFIVKGDDKRRGGAIKLPDSWMYEKN